MTDALALPALGAIAFPYGELAAAMVGGNLYLLRLLLPAPARRAALDTLVIVVGFLVVSLGLWLAIAYAVVDPGDASTVAVFLAANSMMAVAGAWLLAVFLRAEEHPVSADGWGWPFGLSALVVGTEAAMGGAFVLALTGPDAFFGSGGAGTPTLLADGVLSAWFAVPMSATMAVFLLGLPIPPAERRLLIAFALPTAAAPLAFAAPPWGAALLAAATGPVLAILVEGLVGASTPSTGFLRTSTAIVAALAAMAVAALASGGLLGPPSTLPFAATMAAIMTVETTVLVRRALGGPPSVATPTPGDAPTPSGPDTPDPA